MERRPLGLIAAAALWLSLVPFAPCVVAEPGDSEKSPQSPSASALDALRDYLRQPRADRAAITDQPFATTPLSSEHAAAAARLLWQDHAKFIAEDRKDRFEANKFELGEHTLKFLARKFGNRPDRGYDLFISLHGGGGAPARVNDQQWQNQIRIYEADQGIIIAPRAPTDAWNMWFQPHIDGLFDRLIETFVALGIVNPNRVYLMGYSAGGDGVYQMAPRMADRWAAAAMMAGHPNDASPLNLRNIGFTIHVGENDGAFDRNAVARQWGEKLDTLRKQDPDGYRYKTVIHEGKGHWMDGQDAEALAWMKQFTRDPLPEVVAWRQGRNPMPGLYWLAVNVADVEPGDTIRARRDGQRITLQTDKPFRMRVRLNDKMLDLDQPIQITGEGYQPFRGKVHRTIAMLATSLQQRGDPASLFAAEVEMQPGT